MGEISVNKIFCRFLLLCAAACIMQPVMADNGTISIAYRGSGGDMSVNPLFLTAGIPTGIRPFSKVTVRVFPRMVYRPTTSTELP